MRVSVCTVFGGWLTWRGMARRGAVPVVCAGHRVHVCALTGTVTRVGLFSVDRISGVLRAACQCGGSAWR